jgi:hypothetical protein
MIDGLTLTELILSITAAIVVVMMITKLIIDRKHIIFMSSHNRSHKRKETQLLNRLATDIKQNPNEWIPIAYSMSQMKDASLVNDKKNMAIILSSEGSSIALKMNIKSADKYRETDIDTLVTQISGAHVRKFKQQAEEYIDSRGKELTFFEDLLNKKL